MGLYLSEMEWFWSRGLNALKNMFRWSLWWRVGCRGIPVKARRSGWIWDIFWSFAGFTGWGRFGEDDEKKRER